MISLLLLLAWNLLGPVLHYRENTVLVINVVACLCPVVEMFVTRFVVKKRWVFLSNIGLCLFLFVVLSYEITLEKQQKIMVSSKIDKDYIESSPYLRKKRVYVKVQIANRCFLPSSFRILNCGWHGCVGIFPEPLWVYSCEGCDGTVYHDYTISRFKPLEKTMQIGVDEECYQDINKRWADGYAKHKMQYVPPKYIIATLYVEEPGPDIYEWPGTYVDQRVRRLRFLSANNLEIPIVQMTTKDPVPEQTTDTTNPK